MRDFTVRELHVVWEIFRNKYEISTKGGGGWGAPQNSANLYISLGTKSGAGQGMKVPGLHYFVQFPNISSNSWQVLPLALLWYKVTNFVPFSCQSIKNLETSRKRFFVPPSGAEHQSNPNLNNLLVHGELQSVFNIKNP